MESYKLLLHFIVFFLTPELICEGQGTVMVMVMVGKHKKLFSITAKLLYILAFAFP